MIGQEPERERRLQALRLLIDDLEFQLEQERRHIQNLEARLDRDKALLKELQDGPGQ